MEIKQSNPYIGIDEEKEHIYNNGAEWADNHPSLEMILNVLMVHHNDKSRKELYDEATRIYDNWDNWFNIL